MQEELIHFIWLNQLFNKSNLKTVFGEELSVLKQGIHNFDAGPDFSNAKILMDELEWRGDVEIHYKSSQWDEHKHNRDVSYNQVILHVVWEHDKEVYRFDGSKLPTIELKDRVSNSILEQANSFYMSPHHVPCQNYLDQVDSIYVLSALNRALIQRLEQKSDKILLALENTKGDWEEVAYQTLANIIGSKVNGDAFQELVLRMPFKILKKYSNNLLQLEALLFGVSGLLVGQNNDDEYLSELNNEFAFLAEKHGLNAKVMELSWWKFSRLRPANFPTIRIAQLARILNTNSNLFSLFIEADISMLTKKLRVVQSEYWQNHYLPDRPINKSINGLGKASLDSIIINVAAPISMAYARSVNDLVYQERAVKLLSSLAPEVNRISKMWRSLGVKLKNGAETQGAIELFNSECANKKCLSCNIGFQILKSA